MNQLKRPSKGISKSGTLIQALLLTGVLSLFAGVGIATGQSACSGHPVDCDPGSETCALEDEYCKINGPKYQAGGSACQSNTIIDGIGSCGQMMEKTAGSMETNCTNPAGSCGGTAPDGNACTPN